MPPKLKSMFIDLMQETQVRSLDQEDPLEKGMATHSSILAWRISWTEEPGGSSSPWGQRESHTAERLTLTQSLKYLLSGPLQKVCQLLL